LNRGFILLNGKFPDSIDSILDEQMNW
jgi:hypothetical protein